MQDALNLLKTRRSVKPVELAGPGLSAAEVDTLLADASRARKELGWVPKVSFEQLVRMMVDEDLAQLRAQEGDFNAMDTAGAPMA